MSVIDSDYGTPIDFDTIDPLCNVPETHSEYTPHISHDTLDIETFTSDTLHFEDVQEEYLTLFSSGKYIEICTSMTERWDRFFKFPAFEKQKKKIPRPVKDAVFSLESSYHYEEGDFKVEKAKYNLADLSLKWIKVRFFFITSKTKLTIL